jgi:hypothetical protein
MFILLVAYEIAKGIFVEKARNLSNVNLSFLQEADVLYTKELFDGKGSEYVLSDAGVEVRPANMKSLRELMELRQGERHKDSAEDTSRKTTSKVRE